MEREEQAMNITYEKCGDYLIPNLIPNPEPEGELQKFGLMRKSYWKSQERYLFWLAVIRRIKEKSADDTGTGGGKI